MTTSPSSPAQGWTPILCEVCGRKLAGDPSYTPVKGRENGLWRNATCANCKPLEVVPTQAHTGSRTV